MEIVEPSRLRKEKVRPIWNSPEDDQDYPWLRSWQPALPRSAEPPRPYPPFLLHFPSANEGTERAYRKFLSFYSERPCTCRLNRETGLVGYLYGNLRDDDGLAPIEASKEFLITHELMLTGVQTGVQKGVRLEVRRITTWLDNTTQVRLTQTNSQGIPVYGGHIVLTFSGGRLMMVSNSLYPATAAELDIGSQPKGSDPDVTLSVLRASIPEEIGVADDFALPKALAPTPFYILPVRSLASAEIMAHSRYQGLYWELVDDDWQQYVELEQTDSGAGPGEYRLVEYVPWQDRFNHRWVAFIDQGDGLTKPKVITYQFDEAYDTRKYVVFRYSQDAADARNSIINGNALALDQLITKRNLRLDLNLGNGIRFLRDGSLIRFDGDMVCDPWVAADVSTLAETDLLRFLTANVYFHIGRAQREFALSLATADIEVVPAIGEQTQDPLQRVLVQLKNENRGPRTKLDETSHHFQLILTPGNRTSAVRPTFEGGLDADVITHEYTHAVIGHYFAAIFQHGNGDARDTARRGLNEAVAYYFACRLEGNPAWGECAYSKWQAVRRLDGPVAAMNMLPDDPAGIIYKIAMWWATVLWRLSRIPALQPDFSLVLLQALEATASVQASTLTPVATVGLELDNLFGTLGVMLRDLARNQAGRDAVESLLRTAGVPID